MAAEHFKRDSDVFWFLCLPDKSLVLQEALLLCLCCLYSWSRMLDFERQIQQPEHCLGPSCGCSEPNHKLCGCSKLGFGSFLKSSPLVAHLWSMFLFSFAAVPQWLGNAKTAWDAGMSNAVRLWIKGSFSICFFPFQQGLLSVVWQVSQQLMWWRTWAVLLPSVLIRIVPCTHFLNKRQGPEHKLAD